MSKRGVVVVVRTSVVAVVLSAVMGAGLTLAAPASALDSSSIRLSALSVNVGTPIRVQIPYLYSASTCTLSLDGAKRTRPITVKVRNSTAKASMSTKGLPTGTYVVRANCGKDGRAVSSSFSVVPQGSPTRATCDVAEYGFSAGADGETSYGVRISNGSPALTADSVQLSIALLDGAGRTLTTTSEYAMDIAPGESVYAGGYASAVNVASIRVAAVCESTTETPLTRLRGQAQFISPRNSSIYPVEFGGSFANPLRLIISSGATMEYVTRNAAGAITGGGSTYPDAFVPIGGTGTWSTLGVMYPANVTSVDWVMDTREQ